MQRFAVETKSWLKLLYRDAINTFDPDDFNPIKLPVN